MNIIRRLMNGLSYRYTRYQVIRRTNIIQKKIRNCGENLHIFGNIDVINPQLIDIGSNCSINHGVYINAFNPISIGNDVTLSAGVKIISTGIDYVAWASGRKKHIMKQDIIIGDHVWIGANAMVLGGVKITGKYVVVAAGAVVTTDISEDYCVIAGCPAKIILTYKDKLEGNYNE